FAAPGGSDYLDSNFGSAVTVTAAATSGGVDAKLAHRGLITGTVTDVSGHGGSRVGQRRGHESGHRRSAYRTTLRPGRPAGQLARIVVGRRALRHARRVALGRGEGRTQLHRAGRLRWHRLVVDRRGGLHDGAAGFPARDRRDHAFPPAGGPTRIGPGTAQRHGSLLPASARRTGHGHADRGERVGNPQHHGSPALAEIAGPATAFARESVSSNGEKSARRARRATHRFGLGERATLPHVR
ncbi:MAG: hypothetical protein QOD61_2396, partial [Solirubrobacteraceae bacterium]|nr:hypothetical protein [Solirubrobacteraceae bacterium]